MTNSEQALRDFAEKQFPLSKELKKEVLYNQIQQAKQNECLSDLTALISEGYVSKKAYNVIKEHYQSALAAKDINRDYINKYYYPKEFVEWKDKKDLRYSSLHNRYYSDTDNGMREFTLDELFNYWEENER